MKKYLVEVLQGYETQITFNSHDPLTGKDIPQSDYTVPWTVKPGIAVYKTKSAALAAIEMHKDHGGKASLILN